MTARWARRLARPALLALRAADRTAGRARLRRSVLIEARTPMNLAVLQPVFGPMLEDERLDVRFTGAPREDLDRAFAAMGLTDRVITRERGLWSRVDLYINADPWDAVTLRRTSQQLNFFHGVAGKYDLDCPAGLPIGFDRYDRVAFPNESRMKRYVEAGIVRPDRAVLVGYPKVDALVARTTTQSDAAAALGLDIRRSTVIYAPTFSPASSLQQSGEAIVGALLAAGWNVIAKLHDRSGDPDPKYSGGVDWRSRLERFAATGRFLFAAGADSTPYVLASDAMVTDHSSIGFEFCVLDRPLVVFDAPDLASAARINPEKISLLRSAAAVVSRVEDLNGVVRAELESPDRRAEGRRRAAGEAFYRPGTATDRALRLACNMLGMIPALRPSVTAAGEFSEAG